MIHQYANFKDGVKNCIETIPTNFLARPLEDHGSVQKVAALFRVDRATIFRKLKKRRPNGDKQK